MAAPTIAVRLVSTYGEHTRRVDLQITGARGVLHEDGRATPFDTERLWPTVRDLLPPLDPLTADPTGRRQQLPDRDPGPDWTQRCRAMVAVATLTESGSAVRTWFATDDELWSAPPLHPATPGDLAELLVWDVTGALETLLGTVAT